MAVESPICNRPGMVPGRSAALPRLDGDQAVDDPPALHQKLVHRRVNAIDVHTQVGERFGGDFLGQAGGSEKRALNGSGALIQAQGRGA